MTTLVLCSLRGGASCQYVRVLSWQHFTNTHSGGVLPLRIQLDTCPRRVAVASTPYFILAPACVLALPALLASLLSLSAVPTLLPTSCCCLQADGNVWEKAGVNVSVVYGSMPPEAYRAAAGTPPADLERAKAAGGRVPFFAAGISSVMHPRNPHCPTMHFNYRYAALRHYLDLNYCSAGLDVCVCSCAACLCAGYAVLLQLANAMQLPRDL